MNFAQFLLILRARYKLVLKTLAAIMAVTLLASLLLPKSYKATATLVLNYKGIDPVTGLVLPSQLMPGYLMATQVDIITSPNVALQVVDALKLTEGEEVHEAFMKATKGRGDIRNWRAEQLLKRLDVSPSRDSSVMKVSFSSPDPQFSANVVNAFANAYQQTNIQLKADPSRKAASYFNSQVKVLRDKFEEAQRKASQYQQENGIFGSDNRADIEAARLSDLSNQLVQVQGQLMDMGSRWNKSHGNGINESPDVVANPLLQNLKSQLAQAELKFAGISETFTENHPRYLEAKAEVARLRETLNEQIKVTMGSIAKNIQILKQRESDLQTAIAEQKRKVLDYNRKHGELKVLTNEMESAQRAYETASQRYTQNTFEGQANQTDIAVLNPAVAPVDASFPKLFLNMLLSIFLGSLLGMCLAMLAEILDRRVRSRADLLNVLDAPVLATMAWNEPMPQLS